MTEGLGRALENRRFAALWAANLVSSVGSSVHSIAVIWLAYDVSGDPLVVSAVAVAALVPDLLFSVPAGALVDRWNRKRVMIAADLTRAVAVGALPVVALYGPESWLLPAVVAAAVVEGSMAAFVTPARSAVIPAIVDRERLDAANGLLALTTNAARICYVFGGALIAVLGTTVAFGINAASFLLAAVLLGRVPTSAGVPESDASDGTSRTVLRDAVDGLRYVVRTPIVVSVVFLSMIAGVATGPLAVVLPFFVETQLDGGSAAYGLLYGSTFVGTICGSVLVGAKPNAVTESRGPVMIVGLAVSGVALATLPIAAASAPLPLVTGTLCMAAFGAGIAAVQVPGRTLMHALVPDDHRGRVFSIVKALALATPPLAIAVAGPLLEAVGAARVLAIEAGIIVLAALALLASPLAGVRGRSDPVRSTSESPTSARNRSPADEN
ncbi:MFS transporter [Salinilacihabitans rarus]|uniref:MFS transporter n=1 Tax=Salinilacihabitans rarus TaxID=2961596 RepID=UPI0020C879AB|nr:MFS transporter [Salinilacihabitans rarus]